MSFKTYITSFVAAAIVGHTTGSATYTTLGHCSTLTMVKSFVGRLILSPVVMPPGELLLDVAPRLERLEGLDHVEVGNLLEFWKKEKKIAHQ